MSKLSNTKILKIFTTLLILLIIAKLISLIVWLYISSDGVELNAKKSYKAKYQRVDCKNMLLATKVQEQQTKQSAPTYSINSLLLKGLYGNQSNGYAIVAKKSSPKTTIVAVGEEFAGYKLKDIFIDYVIFTKGNKEYTLSLKKVSQGNSRSFINRLPKGPFNESSSKNVTKNDIHSYSRNPSQIWKDIAIAPYKQNGKITGFRVGRIKANSKMAALGLRVGDILIRANNIELTSFNDAIKLYKDIDNIDTLALVVLRNNQEKEIIYEIR